MRNRAGKCDVNVNVNGIWKAKVSYSLENSRFQFKLVMACHCFALKE